MKLPSKDLCRPRLSHKRGFALVMVLIIIAVLATIVTEMGFSSSINAKVTANMRDSTKASYLAKSGINMCIQRVRMDTIAHQLFSSYIGNTDSANEFWWATPLMYPLGSEMFKDMLADSGIDKSELDSYNKSQDIGGSLIADITDESSRINLNDMQLAGTTPNGAYLVLLNLFYLPKFNRFFREGTREDIVNAIVDWVDFNTEVAGQGGGIEDADYRDYHVKNNPFFSFREVKLVKGITYGLYAAMEPFITIFPYTVPQSSTPLSKINLNTAPREVIASLFDRSVVSNPWELAKEIIKARDEEGATFNSKQDFLKLVSEKLGFAEDAAEKPVTRAVENILDVRTDFFRARSSGVVEDATKTVTTVIDRRNNQYAILYWGVQ